MGGLVGKGKGEIVMGEFKGTAGPWKVRNERVEFVKYVSGGIQSEVLIFDIQNDPANIAVVQIRKNTKFRVEATANARLIAAAPDLLEALQNIVDQFKRVDPLYSSDKLLIEKGEAAIAKALGEES